MEQLVIITIITVIQLTYRRNSMQKKKDKQQQQTNKQTNLTLLRTGQVNMNRNIFYY